MTSALGALVAIALVLLVTRLLRTRVSPLVRFHIPAALIAGALLAALGPHGLGRVLDGDGYAVIPEAWFDTWKTLPGLLINVVFAGLFLGKRIPKIGVIWRLAGAQAMFGQSMAWGQYAIGIALATLVLAPAFGIDPLAGALIEMGFQGGHGIAAGLSDTFNDLGFSEGIALTDGLATWGIVVGVVIGTLVINIAQRSSWYRTVRERTANDGGDENGAPRERAPAPPRPDDRDASLTDPLSVNLGWVLAAVALGWLAQQGLAWVERATYGPAIDFKLLGYVPLFPLAMLGGIVIEVALRALGRQHLVDRTLIVRIAETALDFTILAAVATLAVQTIEAHWESFLILAVAGTAWCCFCLAVLAPRMLDQHWLERGICDFGQSMGMTAVGLLMLRIADPENRTGAAESFGYKQLLFEPFVGGGLVTTAALPLLSAFGPWPFFGVAFALTLLFAGVGVLVFGGR